MRRPSGQNPSKVLLFSKPQLPDSVMPGVALPPSHASGCTLESSLPKHKRDRKTKTKPLTNKNKNFVLMGCAKHKQQRHVRRTKIRQVSFMIVFPVPFYVLLIPEFYFVVFCAQMC